MEMKLEALEGSNGKAQVLRMKNSEGKSIAVLFSYGLCMCVMHDGRIWRVNASPSVTTSRHVCSFTGLKGSVFNSLPSTSMDDALSLRGDSSPVYGGNPRGEV